MDETWCQAQFVDKILKLLDQEYQQIVPDTTVFSVQHHLQELRAKLSHATISLKIQQNNSTK